MLRGAIAAAVTPLAEDGATIDEDAFASYLTFLSAHGVDGVLALGTTGEGVLFDVAERTRIAELFLEHRGELLVAVHCGAQNTSDTVELAEHAAESGADAVAVIAPPYFALDADELLAHFAEAARACEPTPFYVYEFAARSGYAVPLETLDALRDQATNFVGLKVSDAPWDRFAPYLLDGLDIFVGPEALIPQGFAAGAAGAVSGLAASFPDVVAALVRNPTPENGERVGALRASLQALPFHAASKTVLGLRGVPVRGGVRPPLRGLTDGERADVAGIVEAHSS
ncbi:MAG TPA: dihydrodipicolinate synthase family protein [Gaiellaceae bacterium]|nr:dihydrodipicolinate synthase family protein [Gaiellaceae bacterium]